MPAPSFLSGLPKPVLFGLYGAIGGLLGAVLLGEPAWQLLEPSPAPPPEPVPQVAVSVPPSVQLYQGTNNTFVVQIARADFEGPVTIKATGLPASVKLDPVTIETGKNRAEMSVQALPEAVVGTTKLTVSAAGGGAKETTSIDLVIAQAPPPPPGLAVSLPPTMKVFQRGKCKFVIQVARARFDGPVKVVLGSLPAGVTTDPIVVPAGKTEVEVTLTAANNTPISAATVTATAEADADGTPLKAQSKSEFRVQEPPAIAVDVIFVLDVTGSMGAFIEGVKDGIRDFAKELGSKQIDFRIGLLAFRDVTIDPDPLNLLTFEDSPFTTNVETFRDKVASLRADGGGDTPESSLEAMTKATEQPFRQGATKVLLLITDAPPKVKGGQGVPQTAAEELAGARKIAKVLKSKEIDVVHLVVRKDDLPTFTALMEAGAIKGSGKYFDLEQVSSGRVKFAAILPEVSRAISETVAARPASAEVAAAPPPPVVPAGAAATPTASSAPPPPTAPSVKSLQSEKKYAPGSEGLVVVRSGVWTGAIAALVCLALLAGQHHYLRGSFPAAAGALAGFGGGLIVGIVGGVAGQGIYLVAPDNVSLGLVFQVLGWSLLGALAGVGLSLFIPNLKWVYGLAGGAIGGAVGAGGYLAVTALAGDLAGRLIGGLIVGFCIGLMVALVEAAFRRAWLEVRFGARETITVNLGPEPVKVGGDARACTVWARGAAPLALRFFLRDGQVICDDAVMKRETPVGDGFAKEVGNVTVTVRTGSSTAPATPQTTRPSAPPPLPKSPAKSSPSPMSLDDDDFGLPMAKSSAPPLAKTPVASSPAPLSLDEDLDLPMVKSPPSATPPVAAKPLAPASAARPEIEPLPASSAPKPPSPAVPPKPAIPIPPRPAIPASGARPPLPAAPPKPAILSAPPKPPVPSVPVARPPVPAVPPLVSKPAAPAGPRHPDACPTPTCGRVNAGKPGARYCVVCDHKY